MAFSNRVRLPFKLTRAQFPEERSVFRKSNGAAKVLSVVVRKTYEGETDYFPEKWHQRLKLALAHDTVTYEGEKYVGNIAAEGEYTIEWPDFMDYPTGKASFGVQVTPFDATNSNCTTLAEVTQVVLVDDNLGTLPEGGSFSRDVADNDSICCYPATFEIVSYNSDYVAATPTISPLGILTFTLKTPLVSANGLKLFTYRVTCPNGGYDEADVFADIDGSIEGCLAPTALINYTADPNSLGFSWTAPASIPVGGYGWDIRNVFSPGIVVQSGTTSALGVLVTALASMTCYTFHVWSICAEGEQSNVITLSPVCTTPPSTNCGSYEIGYNDGSGIPGHSANVTVRGCDGEVRLALVFNMTSIIICALESSPGSPVQIVGPSGTTITYLGNCGTGTSDDVEIRLSNVEGSICGVSSIVGYIDSSYGGIITTGAIIYTNPGFTTPLTGFSFVSEASSGTIFNLNSANGVVGSPTGNTC